MTVDECPATLYNIKRKIDEEYSRGITVEEYEKKVEVIYIQGPNSLDNLLTAV